MAQTVWDEHTASVVAIIDVVNRYGAAIDARDWDRLRSCFAPDGELQFPGRLIVGANAIVEFIVEATAWVAWQQHLVGSHQVAIDGGRATATSVLVAIQMPVEAAAEEVITRGTYHDRLTRTQDGWKIDHRELRTAPRRERGS